MKAQSPVLVTAESCTGGLIAAELADVPGAGQLLDCAFVTCTPAAKKRCLGVKSETLECHNLTSEEVACEMALGALSRGGGNVAVANTGVTDDTDPRIPAGTQCFAWAFKPTQPDADHQLLSETRRFSGDRRSLRQASAEYALLRIPHYHSLLEK